MQLPVINQHLPSRRGFLRHLVFGREPVVTEQAFRAAEKARKPAPAPAPKAIAEAKAPEPKPAAEAPVAPEALKLAQGIQTPIKEPTDRNMAAYTGHLVLLRGVSGVFTRPQLAPRN